MASGAPGMMPFMENIDVNDVADFIKSLKVAELKDHIRLINEQLPYAPSVRLSGNKSDLAARLLEVVEANSHTPKRLQEFAMLIGPLGLQAYMRGLANVRQASQYVVDLTQTRPHVRPDARGAAVACRAENRLCGAERRVVAGARRATISYRGAAPAALPPVALLRGAGVCLEHCADSRSAAALGAAPGECQLYPVAKAARAFAGYPQTFPAAPLLHDV